ncbi:aminopeptidase [Candidatus Bathyarchaeota archaeon]|nr:aminopeptidase [Candidatus Bathyarchaeota archaeon]
MQAWESAKNALECVLEAKEGEKMVIFCDREKMDVGEAFAVGALRLGLQTRLVQLESKGNVVRKEVPPNIVKIIEKQTPDIYINLLRGVREETPFRIQLIHMETKSKKERLGHCPGVTLDMLTKGALGLKASEHRKMQDFAFKLIEKLSNTVKLEISNPAGTKLSVSVEGRPFFTDTVIDRKTMKWMNLPTGEVIVAPIEDSLEGKLVCDMAIGGIGPLKVHVTLEVKKGVVQRLVSEDQKVARRVKDSLDTDENSNRVGEFAFGINPKARFVEEFLEAEKLLGTIHIAFGNNSDMPGGKNLSRNHMDLLMSKPTVKAFRKDGSSTTVLVNGAFAEM